MRDCRIANAVLALAVGLSAAPPSRAVLAQAPSVDLSAYPAVTLDALSERHRDWLERDVRWLITPDERDVFLRLSSDAQRDRFVEEFWRQRDPSPGTAHNEYFVEHQKRLAYATEILGRGSARAGWRSDRGRIFILLGEPQSVAPFYNTQLAVPMELWFYSTDVDLGLPAFFYVLFFKPNGLGDFRIYSPVNDGPESLLNEAGRAVGRGTVNLGRARRGDPTGVGDTGGMLSVLDDVDMELSNAAVSLIPGQGQARSSIAAVRSEMLLAQIENLPYKVMPNAAYAYRVLTGAADSTVRFETLGLAADAVGLIDPEGNPFVHFVARAAATDLNLNEHEAGYYVTFDVSRSLVASDGNVLASDPSNPVEIGLDTESARELRRGELTYLDRMPAAPGDHTFGLMIENNVTREYGREEVNVTVPELVSDRIIGGTPFLVTEHNDVGPEYDRFGQHLPFQLGRNFVLPAMDGPFPSGGTLWVFHQLYAPAEATEEIAASYRLVDSTGAVVAEKHSQLPLARKDDHGVLNQLSGVALENVLPGSYIVVVDLDLQGWLTARLPARVVSSAEYTSPFVHARPQPPAVDTGVKLSLALQLRALQRIDESIEVVRGVLSREPDDASALDLLVGLLSQEGRLEDVRELLEPRLARDSRDVDMLLRMAELSADLGEHYDGIRYFERARIAGAPDSPDLLNALAAEYLADGQADKARELISRSLELDPTQPRMRALLESMEVPR